MSGLAVLTLGLNQGVPTNVYARLRGILGGLWEARFGWKSMTDSRIMADMNTNAPTTFPISPETFWGVFAETLRAEWRDPEKQISRLYLDRAPWTTWTTYITGFLKELSPRLSCPHVEVESVLGIDFGYFTKCGGDWEEWAWEVAIEHENNVNWHEELCKLMMINAGLKVLIVYGEKEFFWKVLNDEFIKIHQSRKYYTANCGWLFILGPRSTDRDFAAFKFDGNAIVDITGDRKIIS